MSFFPSKHDSVATKFFLSQRGDSCGKTGTTCPMQGSGSLPSLTETGRIEKIKKIFVCSKMQETHIDVKVSCPNTQCLKKSELRNEHSMIFNSIEYFRGAVLSSLSNSLKNTPHYAYQGRYGGCFGLSIWTSPVTRFKLVGSQRTRHEAPKMLWYWFFIGDFFLEVPQEENSLFSDFWGLVSFSDHSFLCTSTRFFRRFSLILPNNVSFPRSVPSFIFFFKYPSFLCSHTAQEFFRGI